MNNTVKLVIALAVGAALATAVNKLADARRKTPAGDLRREGLRCARHIFASATG